MQFEMLRLSMVERGQQSVFVRQHEGGGRFTREEDKAKKINIPNKELSQIPKEGLFATLFNRIFGL